VSDALEQARKELKNRMQPFDSVVTIAYALIAQVEATRELTKAVNAIAERMPKPKVEQCTRCGMVNGWHYSFCQMPPSPTPLAKPRVTSEECRVWLRGGDTTSPMARACLDLLDARGEKP
jgi:hypothetical protein